MSSRSVLVTRPAADAEETAARIAAMGFAPILAPMMAIRPLPVLLPAKIDAVLLTSRNALPALPPSLHVIPLLAVGQASAAAARARGFAEVRSADADADALEELVARTVSPGSSLLLPTARGQGDALAAGLRRRGFLVHRSAAYEARPARVLPPPAIAALKSGLHAALFFSPATARAFVAAILRASLDTETRSADACAIGPPVGVALEALPWRRIRVAVRPTQDDVLALLR